MVTARQGGFTLVEAIVALTLSSVLVVLVSTVFLVQNQYYAIQLERSAAQDNARAVTEMVASEIRSTMFGGVVIAESDRLVVRAPMVLGVVCGHPGHNRAILHVEGGIADIDTDEVDGVAMRDSLTGEWSYHDADWGSYYQYSSASAAECASQGADTTSASSDFLQFRRFNTYFGGLPDLGSVLMFYRNVEYTLATSGLDPSVMALYRGPYGGTLVEFATGMDATAQFKYRTGGSTYADRVTGTSNLESIDAIRIEAQALRKPRTGGVDDVSFGWGVNVYLRNGG